MLQRRIHFATTEVDFICTFMRAIAIERSTQYNRLFPFIDYQKTLLRSSQQNPDERCIGTYPKIAYRGDWIQSDAG